MNMLERKEQLFQHYYETTKLAVVSADSEEVASLVEKREELISQINGLELQTGQGEINENIKKIIKDILPLNKELRKKLERFKEEAQHQIRSLKNAQKLKNQYEQKYAMADGVFYDKRK